MTSAFVARLLAILVLTLFVVPGDLNAGGRIQRGTVEESIRCECGSQFWVLVGDGGPDTSVTVTTANVIREGNSTRVESSSSTYRVGGNDRYSLGCGASRLGGSGFGPGVCGVSHSYTITSGSSSARPRENSPPRGTRHSPAAKPSPPSTSGVASTCPSESCETAIQNHRMVRSISQGVTRAPVKWAQCPYASEEIACNEGCDAHRLMLAMVDKCGDVETGRTDDDCDWAYAQCQKQCWTKYCGDAPKGRKVRRPSEIWPVKP